MALFPSVLLAGLAAGAPPPAGVRGLPSDVVQAMRASSRAQDAAATSFGCREIAWKDDGRRRKTDYLLVRAEVGLQEWRSSGADDRDGPTPPPFTWTLLFSDRIEPLLAFRDLGERLEGFRRVRALAFRGALPFDGGADVREWEGRLDVDADTLEPLGVEATPAGQHERMRVAYHRREESTRLVLGLFGGGLWARRLAPAPLGRRLRVRFEPWRGGVVLPTDVEMEILRQLDGGGAVRVVRTRHRRYEDCRRFTVEERERLDGMEAREPKPR